MKTIDFLGHKMMSKLPLYWKNILDIDLNAHLQLYMHPVLDATSLY